MPRRKEEDTPHSDDDKEDATPSSDNDSQDDIQRSQIRALEVQPSPEFEQHHIVTLKPLSQWNKNDKKMHLKYNRILQRGYSHISPLHQIELALISKEDWLTDIICPKVAPACKLNIAADLATKFKVSSDNLDVKAQEIYEWIIRNNPDFEKNISEEISLRLSKSNKNIEQRAKELIKIKYPNLDESNQDYAAVFKAISTVETERERKKITHQQLKEKLEPLYPQMVKLGMLEHKTLYPKGKNKDYSFLGAAGSGKSTITRQFMSDTEKLDYIILATDDYRGVKFDEEHEKIQTDQVFIKTQDLAYSIKELIQQRLESNVQERPNLILDCVSLESWHRALLKEGKIVSTVACLNDIGLVPERVYLRALDESGSPADKGRQVHTPSLLGGHASASARLLSSIPDNVRTTLYDTNVSRGQKPKVLGVVDTTNGKHQIDILQLSKFSQFLAKANVNIDATFKGELYRDEKKSKHRFTFDSHYQAEQIVKLIKPAPPFKNDSYQVILKNELGQAYASIVYDERNGLQFKVLNKKLLLAMLNENNKDSLILKSVVMQIHWKNMDAVRKNEYDLGKNNAQDIAVHAVIPEINSISKWERAKTKHKTRFRLVEYSPTSIITHDELSSGKSISKIRK
jgi:hypothetical protein